jgi:lysophosphatidate acyltransferase
MNTILVWILYPFFFAVALTVLLYTLSLAVPQAAFPARLLASYLCLIACALYGVVASIILRPFGLQHSAQYVVARAFKFVMRYATGVTVEVDDPHNYLGTVRPAVFIGPHQTELDILILGAVFPTHCSVTAKASLKRMPVLGWFMALSGSVFIDRANSKSARGAMQGAADEMKRRGQSVWMFPEGTRSYAEEPGLLPFKKGAFHLAVQAGVPIVPVVSANYSNVLYVKKFRFRSGVVKVKGM